MDRSALLTALAVAVASPLAAQAPLTLAEAFKRADAAAFANRIAAGESRVEDARATASLQGILPAIHFDGGVVRTDNPLGAFGSVLQQRAVSAASFNAATLNSPAPLTNWSGGVVVEVPIFNADGWAGRAAALRAAEAARASSGWVRETTRADVVRAYFGLILAREETRTLESAVTAAQAHLRQAESLVANGLATRSDALLAAVQRGRLEAELIGARGHAAIAIQRLSLLLGQPGDTAFAIPDALPPAARIRNLLVPMDAAAERLDVSAARLQLGAARSDSRRANAGLLPRVNGFSRLEWNSPDRPFGGRSSYTVGVMASWSPLTSAAQIADRQATQGRTESARAAFDAVEAGAQLERFATTTALAVSAAQLDIAEVSVTQAAEAHRIIARKYDGGLATIAELLGAAVVETEAQLGLAAARYQVILAAAAARQAAGADLMALAALEN